MMKVVCAECKRDMGEKMGPDITTHTICPSCMAKLYPECDKCGHIIVGQPTSVSRAGENLTLCGKCAEAEFPGTTPAGPDGPEADSDAGYGMSSADVAEE